MRLHDPGVFVSFICKKRKNNARSLSMQARPVYNKIYVNVRLNEFKVCYTVFLTHTHTDT